MTTARAVLARFALAVAAVAPATATASAALQPVAAGADQVDAMSTHTVWVKGSSVVLDGVVQDAMAGGRRPDLGTGADGRLLVAFARRGDVWVFDARTDRARRVRSSDPRRDESHPAISRGQVAWVQQAGKRQRIAYAATPGANRATYRNVPNATRGQVTALELSGRVTAVSTVEDECCDVTKHRITLVRPGGKPRQIYAETSTVNRGTKLNGLAMTSSYVYFSEEYTSELGEISTTLYRGAPGRKLQAYRLGEPFAPASGEEPDRYVSSIGVGAGGSLLLATYGVGTDRIERDHAPGWR